MKKFAATAAIALALVSGAAFAERGSAEFNTVSQPSSSASHQIESRQASVHQVVARNSGAGNNQIVHASSHGHGDRTASIDQVVARNGGAGNQPIVHANSHGHGDRTASIEQLVARNGHR